MRYLFYFSQVCFFSSCMYYSLAGSIPPHINSVAIPIVENQTAEFGMSESVTENLLAKFNDENILRVTDENNASSVLALSPNRKSKDKLLSMPSCIASKAVASAAFITAFCIL